MRKLPDQKVLKDLLIYNELTGLLIWKFRPRDMFKNKRAYSTWNSRFSENPAFTAKNDSEYFVGAINGIIYRAHRIIWKLVNDEEPKLIDHINGKRSDNRLINLRSVNSSENSKNIKLPVTNKSGIIGVSWSSERKKWFASIRVNTKEIGLGRYINLEDAVNARKLAEIKYGFHENHGRN